MTTTENNLTLTPNGDSQNVNKELTNEKSETSNNFSTHKSELKLYSSPMT